jgi:hypothetical protein
MIHPLGESDITPAQNRDKKESWLLHRSPFKTSSKFPSWHGVPATRPAKQTRVARLPYNRGEPVPVVWAHVGKRKFMMSMCPFSVANSTH